MSHSLRIGGPSALFQATGEIELVKRTGRLSSSGVQGYLHDGEVALRDAVKKMATIEQRGGTGPEWATNFQLEGCSGRHENGFESADRVCTKVTS